MTRTRTYGPTETWEMDGYSCTSSYYNSSTDTTTSQIVPFSFSYRRDYLYASMDDVSTIGFDNLKRRGAIICNPMKKNRIKGQSSPCHLVATAKWVHPYGHWLSRNWRGQVSPLILGLGDAALPYGNLSTPTVSTHDLQELVAEAYGRMSSTPYNLWVVAGEMRENIEMIRVLLHGLIRVMRFRARDFIRLKHLGVLSDKTRSLGKIIEVSSDLWLYLRYGIRPFIADLLGLLQALQTCGDHARARFSSREAVTTAHEEQVYGYANFDNLLYLGREMKVKVHSTAHAGVLCQPAFESLTLADLIGVGNYVQGAWDLVPYSFVIDWFFNVSGLLATWSPNLYVHPLCDWVVVTTVTERETRIVPGTYQVAPTQGDFTLDASSVTCTCMFGNAIQYTTEQERMVNVSKAFIPSFRLKVDAAKVLDLLALARQLSYMR